MCDCYSGGWQCDQNCVEQSLQDDSLFYPVGTVGILACRRMVVSLTVFGNQNLYNNVTYLYPDANIWLTGMYITPRPECVLTSHFGSGHSLGGALSALLGLTFGAPVVAYEAPGEKMAAKRLHLPSPVSRTPVLRTPSY